MGVVSAYCVELNGSPLQRSRCKQLLAFQGSLLLLALLCMRRVLQLAGGRRRRPCKWTELETWVFALQLVLVGAAMAAAAAVVAITSPHHSSASMVCGASVALAAWFFYMAVLRFEFVQHRRSCMVITLVVALCAMEEVALGTVSLGDLVVDPFKEVLETWKPILSTGIAAVAVLRAALFGRTKEYSDGVEALKASAGKNVKGREGQTNPLDYIGWLSQLSYHWISPFISLGKKRRLEMHDVPNLPLQDTTSVAADLFQQELQREFRKHKPSDRSFLRVTRRLYGPDVLVFGVWSTANKAIGLASPLLLKLFLDWAGSSHPSLEKGYYLAAAMVGRSILSAVSGTQYNLAWKRFDLRVRAGLVSAIYARTLQLSGHGKRQAGGLGRITNLISVDVGRIVGMPSTLFDMVLIPAEIAVALVLLSKAVSVAFVAGIAVLGVMLPLQTVLGRKIQRVTADMMQYRDERVGLAAETLKAIRTLKLLGWVLLRLEAMGARRSLEMGRLQVRKYLDAFCVFFWASTPVIVQVSVFATAVFSGRDISAADAFTAIALLDRLIFPMNYFPWIINGFLEAKVSALRIRAFLFRPDEEIAAPLIKEKSDKVGGDEQDSEAVVSWSNCTFEWNSTTVTSDEDDDDSDIETSLLLKDSSLTTRTAPFKLHINELRIRAGTTYVVCGPVGAGKTSLLMALLGEMPNAKGFHRRQQSSNCAYSPQSPWLFRGSVRENITMSSREGDDGGERVNRDRYNRVLRACELDVDLQGMKPPYDVAESGSNFSGGQRARINLARALYQQANLYLLDDPLSGLDMNTARKVVANCFKSRELFPADSAVVIVTHSLQLLPLFPGSAQVVVVDGGCIAEQGTYDDLKSREPTSRLMVLFESSPSVKKPVDTTETSSELPEQCAKQEGDSTKPEGSPEQAQESDGESTQESDDEHRESGVVGWQVWRAYSISVGWALSGVVLLSVAAMQVSRNSLDWWIAVYTNGKHSITPHEFAVVLLYIAGANIAAVFLRSFLFAYGGLRAARATYAALVSSVFAAPLRFFEQTPTGRVLNRLSGDTYAVDESLPFILNIFLKDAADVVGALVILFYGNRLVLVLLVPLSVLYFHLQRDYRPSSRHLKRLEAATQSPLLAMFTDTLDGLSVIRAAQKQRQYARGYGLRLNRSQRVSFLSSTTGAWFGLRLDMLGVCVTSFVAVFAVADFNLTGTVNPGILGLTLTYALPIVGKLNSILSSFVDTERQMIAVERVKEYADLEPEEAVVGTANIIQTRDLPACWPARGQITVKALTVTYGDATQVFDHQEHEWEWVGPQVATPALKYVSCDVPAGQKLGICGRTGAGKSTLLNALFRAVPWERSGSILIDDVPLDSLSLQDLRARLTYIPQDVVLFSGTVRSNLDPAGIVDDERIWAVLRKCGGLATAVAKLEHGLDAVVEGGAEEQAATFSKGQAQLLCIARALLRPSKVLCIDEATASIDHETERAISEVIASEFATSTVLMVAHRIQTIMHCDRVLLLDSGRVAESGDPKELAQNPQSLFYRLANASIDESELL